MISDVPMVRTESMAAPVLVELDDLLADADALASKLADRPYHLRTVDGQSANLVLSFSNVPVTNAQDLRMRPTWWSCETSGRGAWGASAPQRARDPRSRWASPREITSVKDRVTCGPAAAEKSRVLDPLRVPLTSRRRILSRSCLALPNATPSIP